MKYQHKLWDDGDDHDGMTAVAFFFEQGRLRYLDCPA